MSGILKILQKIRFTFKIDSVIILAQIKDKDLKEAKYMDSCDSHGRSIYAGWENGSSSFCLFV